MAIVKGNVVQRLESMEKQKQVEQGAPEDLIIVRFTEPADGSIRKCPRKSYREDCSFWSDKDDNVYTPLAEQYARNRGQKHMILFTVDAAATLPGAFDMEGDSYCKRCFEVCTKY